jgi:alpha,alpha-trehalase
MGKSDRSYVSLNELSNGSVRILDSQGEPLTHIEVPVKRTLAELIEGHSNRFERIEYDDPFRDPSTRRYVLSTSAGTLEVTGVYPLSRLLATVDEANERRREMCTVSADSLLEPPRAVLRRLVPEQFWPALTRDSGPEGIERTLHDRKMNGRTGDVPRLYYPSADETAGRILREIAPQFRRRPILEAVPSEITPEYFESLRFQHGLLTLSLFMKDGRPQGLRFVTPGGRFDELYGWDTHFIILGLLANNMLDLALETFEQQVYELRYYGKILNASRSWSLNRSHAPFITATIVAIYAAMEGREERKAWLRSALTWAEFEYRTVWITEERTVLGGLQRYCGFPSGPAPEVEKGHYRKLYGKYAHRFGMTPEELEAKVIYEKFMPDELREFFRHDVAVRESGHDTSYRHGSDCRCAAFAGVDLNSLLLRYELDMAYLIGEVGGSTKTRDGATLTSKDWRRRAEMRAGLMQKYLFNPSLSAFFDYDVERSEQKHFCSATAWWPMWAVAHGNKFTELFGTAADPRGGRQEGVEVVRGKIELTSERAVASFRMCFRSVASHPALYPQLAKGLKILTENNAFPCPVFRNYFRCGARYALQGHYYGGGTVRCRPSFTSTR